MITFFQAILIGLVQGFTELFPISSLGHSVLLSSLFGWDNVLASETQDKAPFLSFLVILHLATALTLLFYYRKEWVKIIRGFFATLKKRRAETPYEKLAWLLIFATVPAAMIGLIFEHALRSQFARPMSAAVFLTINGFILLAGERARRRHKHAPRDMSTDTTVKNASHTMSFRQAGIIGVSQVGALFAGISRSGITMVGGLVSGLDHEDSARFSFLLATPIILGAALYKLPSFLGSEGDGIRMQTLVGAVAAAVGAYISVRFLERFFRTNTLRPFAYYCLAAGSFMILFLLMK